MSVILEMKGIEKSFPGVKALKNVDLTLHEGEILAVLGENGAGKSTLMKVLTGVYHAEKGIVSAFGKEVNIQNYKDAQKMGISIIFQELSLIPDMNVWENIFLGNEILRNRSPFLNVKVMRKATLSILDTLGVHLDIDAPVSSLSIADQQFVEIAKALSIRVKILILDEPTSTLTPSEVERLFAVMRVLKEQGVGMVFISHHLEELFIIADNVLVLRDGETIAQTPIREISRKQLVEQVIGRSLGLQFPPKRPSVDGEQLLSMDNLKFTAKSKPISFNLKKGEILGIFGLVGSGRTEIMRALIGADPKYSITTHLNGKEVHISSPKDAYKLGIGLLPEDRKSQGLILPFSVEDNISLNNLKKETIDRVQIKKNALEKISMLSIKTPNEQTPVVNLSGGNQQKVIIARWLSTTCNILIFDEPTRGIDVGAKDEIYKIMRDLAEKGKSIILISSELEEILGLSDRILVIRQNEIQAELPGTALEEDVMTYAVGGHK